jgi:outer membrane protein OmpA-like peptidoglycan-associated protein
MRCNPLRWLWGLIPVSMLAFVAFHWERPTVEADLSARARQALDRAGLDWTVVGFQGRDATLSGRATEENEPRKAVDALRRVWGVRVVDARTDLVEEVGTYTWRAAYGDGKVRLSGFVPSEPMRRSIIGLVKAAMPKAGIEDAMKVARGAPNTDLWLGGVGFAVKHLAALKKGEIELDGTTFGIEGEAIDQGGYKALRAAIPGALPKGWTLGRNEVLPPPASPFTWKAKLSANQLVLSGHMPGEALREELFALAKKTFPRVAVVDRMEVASGAPDHWSEAARAGLDLLYQLNEGTAEMKDASLSLSGVAEDEPGADAVRSALKKAAPAGFRTSEAITFLRPRLAAVENFTTAIMASADAIDVTGYAPSEEARAALVDAVRAAFPGRQVRDRLELAAGAPDGWESCMKAGLGAVGRLGAGRAALEGSGLELVGVTSEEGAGRAIRDRAQSEAGGLCEVENRITYEPPREPNLWWHAALADGELVLEGEAPDAAQRAELGKKATSLFPAVRIDDRMTVVSRRSASWSKTTAAALGMLRHLKSGSAALYLDDLLVRGTAPDEASRSAVRESLGRDLPQGIAGREELDVVTAEDLAGAAEAARRALEEADALKRRRAQANACQQRLSETASAGIIRFEYASDALDPKSAPTLDRLAGLMTECPEARIEIAGHTDGDGTPERKQRLSERRAQTVVDYLVKAGVGARRLSAAGYADTRPVAPNDSNANKAKNRRIEFKVVPE